MNFKVGDKVVVIAGSSKGKEGKIIKTLRNENKVIVEGVNIVKKHRKGNGCYLWRCACNDADQTLRARTCVN